MRTPTIPDPDKSAPVSKIPVREPSGIVDLRPFTRIGCIGPDGAKAAFLVEIADSCREHAEIFSLPGVLDHPSFESARMLIGQISGADGGLAQLRDATTSLLVLAMDQDEDAIARLRLLVPESVTVRVLSLNSHIGAEALVAFDEAGGREFFVRSEFRANDPEAQPVPVQSETLFDQSPRSSHVGIKVLGPVMLSGTDYPLERHPKLTELVVFLALHPEGATSRIWTTALWPDRRVPLQTIANRLSEARRIVGFAHDGRPRLRRSGERHLLVDFGCDWRDFQQLAQSDDQEHWRDALALVRGRPFDDLAQGQWVVFEGFLAEIEREIAALALRLGDLALIDNDPELCAWAARQALRACPFDERLHRLLMRAADALGNRAGVESTLRQLALILEIDGNPLHGVHPKTAQLYGELTAPSSRE